MRPPRMTVRRGMMWRLAQPTGAALVLLLALFSFVSALVLAGCGSMNAASRHATPRTSSSPTSLAQPTAPLSVYIGSTDGTVAALNAANGTLRWRSVMASSASTTTVAGLADGAVFVSATNVNQQPLTTELAALRASDGSVLWHKVLAGTAFVVATGSGVVYVALDNGGITPHELQMLRAQNGVVLWRTQVEGTGPLHASMHEGTIYVTSFTTLLPSPGYYSGSQ